MNLLLIQRPPEEEQEFVTFMGSDRLTMWTPDTYISNAVDTKTHSAPATQKSTEVSLDSKLTRVITLNYLDLQRGSYYTENQAKCKNSMSHESAELSI